MRTMVIWASLAALLTAAALVAAGCAGGDQAMNIDKAKETSATPAAPHAVTPPQPQPTEANNMQTSDKPKLEKAVFAAGCFWGVEANFRKVTGVVSTRVGYTGGKWDNPTYKDVCSDRTGHAEAVEVTFDPAQVSYTRLLDIFWSHHDPTTPNRQGPDVGSQYRSVIFYENPEQQRLAAESRAALEKSGKFKRPIVTEIVPAVTFWAAEDYHQQYLEKRGQSSCSTTIR